MGRARTARPIAVGKPVDGQRVIALQVFPDAPNASLSYEDGVPVIPTVPSGIQVLTDRVTAVLDKLEKAPVAGRDRIARAVNTVRASAARPLATY